MISSSVDLLLVFVLAAFVGFEVISKVPSVLHTPLMSGSNAIHGVILVGAMVIADEAHGSLQIEARGVEVAYAIHPVAGRMPGHMNVLLAEADVPYESLDDMEVANTKFAATAVALVVGANDVVNPAARDDPGSPLYGMPILNVDQARHVVFLKRSMRPGFSGVDNALLYDSRTVLLFGDAKASLTALAAAVKQA